MNIRRLWARIPCLVVIVSMTSIMGLSVALPAGAQTYSLWEYPGTHPYLGTPEKAAIMHEATTGVPSAEYRYGVSLHYQGKGDEYYIQDGEFLWNTFTKNKFSKSEYTKVAMKYPKGHEKAGQPLPSDHPNRRAMRYDLGRADGAHVVYPFACGNWALGYFPVKKKIGPVVIPLVAAVVVVDIPEEKPEIQAPNACPKRGFVQVGQTYEPWRVTPVPTSVGYGFHGSGSIGAVGNFGSIADNVQKTIKMVCINSNTQGE